MKRILIIFLMIMIKVNSYGRVGLAEIFFETPGGNIICHCDPYRDDETPILIGYENIKQMERWYFYHHNIIGQGKGYYFIFNESNKRLQYFKTEVKWRSAITKQGLRPMITRWLDLSDSPENFLLFIIITSIITIPLIIGVSILIIILTIKRKMKWNKLKFVVLVCFLCLIGLTIFFQFNLESI